MVYPESWGYDDHVVRVGCMGRTLRVACGVEATMDFDKYCRFVALPISRSLACRGLSGVFLCLLFYVLLN